MLCYLNPSLMHENRFITIISRVKRENIVLKTQSHASLRELIWTILPTFILFLIAVPSIELLYLMDLVYDVDSPIFTYKIIGHQWYWSYEFLKINIDNSTEIVDFDSYMVSDFDVTEQLGLRLLEVDYPLTVFSGKNIRFLVTSTDVIHSWALPSAGVKVDAIPGRLNQFFVYFRRSGVFYGQCSEICGVNHGFMPIKVEVIDYYSEFSSMWFE